MAITENLTFGGYGDSKRSKRRSAGRRVKRDGRSVTHDLNRLPTKDIIAIGFTEEDAELILTCRRVLPVLEDSTTPQIDARKLWERIGKPHGQFRFWADHYISPLIPNEEIRSLETVGKRGGKPKKDYTLSRDMAADLAMQARTPEGNMIRRYFRLMEKVVLRLPERNSLRGERLIENDNVLCHHFTRTIADQTGARGFDLRNQANLEEQRIKSLVTKILTGQKAGHWREACGKGVRDILNNRDLAVYDAAYSMAVALVKAGQKSSDTLETLLGPMYAGKIDMTPYLE